MKSMAVERGWCSLEPREDELLCLCRCLLFCLQSPEHLGQVIILSQPSSAYGSGSESGWGGRLSWGELVALPRGTAINVCGTAVQGAEQKILSALLIQVFCLLRACSTCPCTAVSCCAMGLVQVSAWLASAAFAIWKSNSVNWCSCPTSHRTAPGYLLFTCLPQLGCGVSVIGECFDLFFSGNPKWLFLIMRTGENSACHFT